MKKFKDIQIGDKVYFYKINHYALSSLTHEGGDNLTQCGSFVVDVIFDDSEIEGESFDGHEPYHYIGLTVNPNPKDFILSNMITSSLPLRFDDKPYVIPHSEVVDFIIPKDQNSNILESTVYFNNSISNPYLLFSNKEAMDEAILKTIDNAIKFESERNISENPISEHLKSIKEKFVLDHQSLQMEQYNGKQEI